MKDGPKNINYVWQSGRGLDYVNHKDPPIYSICGPDVTDKNRHLFTGITKASAQLHAKRLNIEFNRADESED